MGNGKSSQASFIDAAKTVRRLRIWIVVLATSLGACTPPWLFPPTGPNKEPTVTSVIDNINRQIACAIQRNSPDGSSGSGIQSVDENSARDAFIKSRPVAAVALTLQVNATEGFNPSVSFITPYAPVKPATSSSTQGLWSLGFQLDGSQQRQLVINYVLDIGKLIKGLKEDKLKEDKCDYKSSHLPKPSPPKMFAELEGDLGLAETVDAEIVGIAKTAAYGIDAPPSQSGTKPPATSFTAYVSFVVTEGINGGPNWKLLRFQGPAGGSGASAGTSGGGSGSSSGSGSSGSSSGGGGGQLLNASRTVTDFVLITFTPTCVFEPYQSNWSSQGACDLTPNEAQEKLHTAQEILKSAKNRLDAAQKKFPVVPGSEGLNPDKDVEDAQLSVKAAEDAVNKAQQDEATASEKAIAREEATAAAKASAAAYGATQNLLYRLGIQGLGQPQ